MTTILAVALLLIPRFDGFQVGSWEKPECGEVVDDLIDVKIAGGYPGDQVPTVHWENLDQPEYSWEVYNTDFRFNGEGRFSFDFSNVTGSIRIGDRDLITIWFGDGGYEIEPQLGIWDVNGRHPLPTAVEPVTWGKIKERFSRS